MRLSEQPTDLKQNFSKQAFGYFLRQKVTKK
jgi:hypothetical protein